MRAEGALMQAGGDATKKPLALNLENMVQGEQALTGSDFITTARAMNEVAITVRGDAKVKAKRILQLLPAVLGKDKLKAAWRPPRGGQLAVACHKVRRALPIHLCTRAQQRMAFVDPWLCYPGFVTLTLRPWLCASGGQLHPIPLYKNINAEAAGSSQFGSRPSYLARLGLQWQLCRHHAGGCGHLLVGCGC